MRRFDIPDGRRVGVGLVGLVLLLMVVLLVLLTVVAGEVETPTPTPSDAPTTGQMASPPTPLAQAPSISTAEPAPVPAPTRIRSDGILRLAGADPLTLDPALSQDVTSWTYLLQVYSGLVSLDDRLEVVPEIASSWTVSDDGRVYTFELRRDVRFHDGRPLTAEDVRFSLERALDPALRSPVAATYLGDIVGAMERLRGRAPNASGIEVVDAHTLRLTIDAPKSYFLAKLTYPTAYVVDRANVSRGARWFEKPNGTGPFKLQIWERDKRLVLERNDWYYREPAYLAGVEYWLAPGSAIALYERDQLDVIAIGPANVERVTDPRGSLSRELIRVPQLSLGYLGFDVSRPPFDDPKVRQAFAMAADKRRLADVLFKRMRVPAHGILPPGMPGHDPALAGLEFDPERARLLLAQSSYGSSDRLPEITLTMGANAGGLGETFAEMYRRNLGVRIAVEEVQTGYFAGLDAREYQMFYLGWVADYPDPQNFLDVLFHGQSDGNHGGFADAAVDRLLERARVEPDRDERLRIYREAERRIVEMAPVVPLFFDTDYVLVKPRVKGLRWTPIGILSLRDVQVE